MANYVIQDGELCHYGVIGMKWGVRRARSNKLRGAKAKRDNAIANATSERDIATAKQKYKSQRKKIYSDSKEEMRKKAAEIRANESEGKRAVKSALKTAGTVAISAAIPIGIGMYAMSGVVELVNALYSD